MILLLTNKLSQLLYYFTCEKKEFLISRLQIPSLNNLINDYLDIVINCISIMNMRLQYRASSEENKDYTNTQFFNNLLDLYIAVYYLTTKDSDFRLRDASLPSINKEKVLKLHELLLINMSLLIEFPNSHDLLIGYMYCRYFNELSQRPAILQLMSSGIKMSVFCDKNITESILSVISTSLYDREEAFKKERFAIARSHNEKIVESLIFNAIYSDSFYISSEISNFLESLLSHQDYSITLLIYQIIEKIFKELQKELRTDHQDETLSLSKSNLNSDKSLIYHKITKIIQIIIKLLNSPSFMSTMNLKDFLRVLLPIYQNLEEEIQMIILMGTNTNYLLNYFQLRIQILKLLSYLCDYEFSISGIMESFKENYYLVEDIPHVSNHQKITKYLSELLIFPFNYLHTYLPDFDKTTPMKIPRKISENEGKKNEKIADTVLFSNPQFLLSYCKNINLALRIVSKMSKNDVGQSVLLYTEFPLKVIPLKGNPSLNLAELFYSILRLLLSNKHFNIDKMHYQMFKILENLLFCWILLSLTPNPGNSNMVFCNSERRKNALKSILFEKNNNNDVFNNHLKSVISQNQGKSGINDHLELLEGLISKWIGILMKQRENEDKYIKKSLNKLMICKVELGIFISYYQNTEFLKKDVDKTAFPPNPRDLESKFEDYSRFIQEKRHLKSSKNSIIQMNGNNSSNSNDKIIKTIHKKLEKSIYDLIYDEKREFWKESRLTILNIMNLSSNQCWTSSYYSPLYSEMNLKYWNGELILNKNFSYDKKKETNESVFLNIKLTNKGMFIQTLLREWNSSKIAHNKKYFLRKEISSNEFYLPKPIDMSFSLNESQTKI